MLCTATEGKLGRIDEIYTSFANGTRCCFSEISSSLSLLVITWYGYIDLNNEGWGTTTGGLLKAVRFRVDRLRRRAAQTGVEESRTTL